MARQAALKHSQCVSDNMDSRSYVHTHMHKHTHTHTRVHTTDETGQRKHLGKLRGSPLVCTHQESFLCNASPVLCSAKLLNERIWTSALVMWLSPRQMQGGVMDTHTHTHAHTCAAIRKKRKAANANFSPEPPAVAMESCHIALPRR